MAFPCEVYTKARSSSLLLTWLEGSKQHLSLYVHHQWMAPKKLMETPTLSMGLDSVSVNTAAVTWWSKGHTVSRRQRPMHSSPASGSHNRSALSSVAFLHLDAGVEAGMLNTNILHRAEPLSFSVLYSVMCRSLVLSAAKIRLSNQCNKKIKSWC